MGRGNGRGKGKGGVTLGLVKADMTPEQLELLRQAEERRAKAAQQSQLLRETLKRERDMAETSKLKIETKWRKIMREAKMVQLTRDVRILQNLFAREVDRRDGLVQMYSEDIEEADMQHTIAIRTHLRAIDTLLELQDDRLRSLERDFLSELEKIEADFAEEREALEEAHSEELAYLKHLYHVIEEEEERKRTEAQAEYERRRNVINERNLERLSQLQGKADSRLEELSARFEDAHAAYLSMQDERVAEYKELVAKDRALVATVESRKAKADTLRRRVRQMRSRLVNSNRDEERRNTEVEQAKAAMLTNYRALKARMRRARTESELRVRALSRTAASAKARGAEASALAERIISLAERCRGLESEVEKVLPLSDLRPGAGAHRVLPPEAGPAVTVGDMVEEADLEAEEMRRKDEAETARAGASGAAHTPGSMLLSPSSEGGPGGFLASMAHAAESRSGPALDPIATFSEEAKPHQPAIFTDTGEPVTELRALERFHQKLNKAMLERLAAEKERERLRAENQQLQDLLTKCLDGLSVPIDAVDKANTLLVVNGRTSIRHRLPVRRGVVPIVEGAHVVAETSRHKSRA